MATRRRPKKVVAVTPGGRITTEMVLGYLAMFTVPDQPISAGKLMRTWANNDLDTTLLPDTRQPVHVFQSACRSVETRKRQGIGTAEVKVDELYEDATDCVYQITQLVRDLDNKLIEHPKAMRVTFNKAAEEIEVDALDRKTFKALAPLEDQIRDFFTKNAKLVPGQKVRAAVRGYMSILGGTNVRKKSGGVYFVPKDSRGEAKRVLDVLTDVLDDLYGGDADLYTIPLANDKGQRSMVEKHFTMNVEERVEEQIGKVATVLKRDSYVRKDLLRNVIEERRALGEQHQQYAALLKDSLSGVQSNLELLDEQVDTLLTKAHEKGQEVEA